MKTSSVSQLLPAICVVVGVLCGAPSQAADAFATIVVTGDAEAKIAADRSVVTLSLSTTQEQVREAVALNHKELEKLIALLASHGLERGQVQAGFIGIRPNEAAALQAYGKDGQFQAQQVPQAAKPHYPVPQQQQYSVPAVAPSPDANASKPVIKDYTASRSVDVVVEDVAKLEEILIGVHEGSLAKLQSVAFQGSEAKKVREGLRADAIQAAKKKAELLTAALGQKLGKAVRIEECDAASTSICPPFSSPLSPFMTAGDGWIAPSAPAPVNPQLISLSVSVKVWFELP